MGHCLDPGKMVDTPLSTTAVPLVKNTVKSLLCGGRGGLVFHVDGSWRVQSLLPICDYTFPNICSFMDS